MTARPIRLTTIFMAGIFTIFAVSALIGWALYSVSGEYRLAEKEAGISEDVINITLQITTLTGEYALYGGKRAEVQWRLKHDFLDKLINETNFSTGVTGVSAKRLRQYHARSKILFEHVLENFKTDEQTGLNHDFIYTYNKELFAELLSMTQAMTSQASLLYKHSRINAKAAEIRIFRLILGFIAVLAFIMVVLWGVMGWRVVIPIRELRRGINSFEGNLEHRLKPKRGDEIGEVALAFNHMAENLKGTLVSRDDLAVEVVERKMIEAELITARNAAERANNAKSEFLSSMSHELRTPLNAILGFTQLLNTDPDHPLTENQIDATEQVMKAGDHLLILIDEVLDLAAIESGNVPIDAEQQDPTPAIKTCTALARNLAEQKGLTFHDRTTEWNLPEIIIDETRFRQVLLNLLSNAVKYNRGGGTVTLVIEESTNGTLRFSVVDSGLGIAKEKQSQIFAPFSRLGLENSDITGTGIGLTITRELTEAMGGAIGFESAMDLGSTFWVEFPIASGTLSLKDRSEEPDSETALLTSHTVLCVEDDPSSLKLLETIIERLPGATMISAHTGELGIDLANIHRPDVILMDINLPGISGIDALLQLKASATTKNIPVIALTALASDKDRKHGMEAGFSEYLTKPVNVENILSVLNQALKTAA